jgi:aryl-alcohol dehydrogenase-like predicted oxidoreductase
MLGRTDRPVSAVGLGTGQIGGDWGRFPTQRPSTCLRRRLSPVTTFSTPPIVYGAGRSERLIGRFLAENPDTAVTVATKIGVASSRFPKITY